VKKMYMVYKKGAVILKNDSLHQVRIVVLENIKVKWKMFYKIRYYRVLNKITSRCGKGYRSLSNFSPKI
jgi:hypothetical protein